MEEVTIAQQNAETKKAEYAKEVLDARQKSQEEIDKVQRIIADSVLVSRNKANTEIEKSLLDVQQARQKAAQEVEKSKFLMFVKNQHLSLKKFKKS